MYTPYQVAYILIHMNIFKALIVIIFLSVIPMKSRIGAQDRRGTGYPDLDLFYDRLDHNVYDEIISAKREAMRTTPLKELVRNYAEKGFTGVLHDPVWLAEYFDQAVTILSVDEYEEFFGRMEEIAEQYKSPGLDAEIEFLRGYIIEVTNEGTFAQAMEILENVARNARKRKDKYMEVRAIAEMWHESLYSGHLTEYFYYAGRLLKELGEVDDGYPFKHKDYFKVGMCYYLTDEYEKAIPLLKKALHDGPSVFSDESNIQARNYLASYYTKFDEQPDSAEYYHRSILELEESVYKQPPHLGIAITNLGRIAMARGEYDKAIAMLEAGKELMLGYVEGEAAFLGGIYISLGRSYLETGRLDKLPDIIDSARMYMERHWIKDMGKNGLFDLMSRYYARIGEGELSSVYLDSMHVHMERANMARSSNMMARGEKMLHHMEKQLLDEKIEKQKSTIFLVSVIMAFCIAGTIVVIYLYRKKRAAYAMLAEKAMEWAGSETERSEEHFASGDIKGMTEPSLRVSDNVPSKEDEAILALIDGIMVDKKAYADPALTLEKLAETTNIPRHLLSRAINRATGKNFSQYINEYRVKEAVRIMSSPSRNGLYIDELYERVGFNSRTSFYRVFKQATGLSPSDFRKSRK